VDGAEDTIRVLLCDDHSIIREGLARLLENAPGIDVVAQAADGREAIERAVATAPDVVMMDLSMPNVDGVEATRRLCELVPDASVVVLTSFADGQRVLDAIDAGAVGYLLKDADGEDVVRAIRAAAAGGSPLDPRAARTVLTRSARASAAGALTPREREVLGHVGSGRSNKVIAQRLGISESTVKAHLTRIFSELGVSDRTQAALWARQHGIE
jgi:DNA-binding NarL/FixJ family response regulator